MEQAFLSPAKNISAQLDTPIKVQRQVNMT